MTWILQRTCMHLKLTGSTMLGAYIAQIFFLNIPTTWKETAFGKSFAPGQPFERLDIVLFSLFPVCTVAGPLFQW